MKEALIVDLDGFIIDVELVPQDTYGVTNLFETLELHEPEEGEGASDPELALVGYRVAIPVPPGLYKPRFDFDGGFWTEGLTQEEIDALHNAPRPRSELDIIGEQLVLRELELLALQSENRMLSQQLSDMESRLAALEGGAGA
jgi:hypothetical protein